jgi:hypothetical protein
MNNHTVTTRKIGCALSVLILLITYSCQQDLTIAIKTNDKRLIVVGEFTNDTTVQSIRLFRSGNLITGKKQEAAIGAKVFVTNRVDTIFFFEKSDNPGLYQTSNKCYGIGGNTYYLSITNIDIDGDGRMDSFSASSTMPVPIKYDSLVSKYGLNGDSHFAVNSLAYYKTTSNGPDYVFKFMKLNSLDIASLSQRLGSGEISRFEQYARIYRGNNPLYRCFYFSMDNQVVVKGDTINFIGYNLTKNQYDFLMAFDENTTHDPFYDNVNDQLNIPSSPPSNIEPASKSAGYFMAYSISKISKVYQGN